MIGSRSEDENEKAAHFLFFSAHLAQLWLSPQIGCTSAEQRMKTRFSFFALLSVCTTLAITADRLHLGRAKKEKDEK
ncbi:MAG: hypothetical protein U0L68_08075 [Prevotellamassilia sp.]|nr:hypothetical protein [Prevotellamassilia sp.]